MTRVHQEWGIDGTIAEIPGWGTYFVWSCMADELQSLCIAKLLTPMSIGPFSVLSQPLEPWETIEEPVNEGPAPLYHDGKVWIAYAASFCKTVDYQIGTLQWDGKNDPLKQTSWTKSSGPVFSSANGNYGTAHNGYVVYYILWFLSWMLT
jgi:GH43 family beta-xylosidase